MSNYITLYNVTVDAPKVTGDVDIDLSDYDDDIVEYQLDNYGWADMLSVVQAFINENKPLISEDDLPQELRFQSDIDKFDLSQLLSAAADKDIGVVTLANFILRVCSEDEFKIAGLLGTVMNKLRQLSYEDGQDNA